MGLALNELKVEVSEIQPCVKKLLIEIPAERVASESETKWKEISKYAHVQGFRKGKAPRHILERMYGNTVLGEVGQKLIHEGYEAAVAGHKLDILGDPSFQDVKVEAGKPVTFSVLVETFPQVSVPDFSGWEFERQVRKIQEKKVDEMVNSILESHAELVPVSDRGAKEGDYVSLDYSAAIDGKEEPKLSGRGQQMIISTDEDNLLLDFHRNIILLREGEEREFASTLPKDFPDPALAEKKVVFKVKVNAVKEKRLPELTDSFVASQTAFENIVDMRLKLRRREEEHEKEKAEEELRKAILKRFREGIDLSIPPKMQSQYAEMYGNRVLRTTRDWGMDIQSQPDFDKAKFEENCREKGEEWARDEVIIESIAKKEKLEPDLAELERLQGQYAEFLKSQDKNTRYNAAMYTLKEALQESVFKFIQSKVRITDRDVTDPEKKEKD